jgi:nucleotide-binding universal stress UspA family protein
MKVLVDRVRAEGIASHAIIKQGAPSAVIPRIIQEARIDLLVLGTHGRGGLKKLALDEFFSQPTSGLGLRRPSDMHCS